jgi:hypothetical protein
MKLKLRRLVHEHLDPTDTRLPDVLDKKELERTLNAYFSGKQANGETLALALDLRIAQEVFIAGGARTHTSKTWVTPLDVSIVDDPCQRTGLQVPHLLLP